MPPVITRRGVPPPKLQTRMPSVITRRGVVPPKLQTRMPPVITRTSPYASCDHPQGRRAALTCGIPHHADRSVEQSCHFQTFIFWENDTTPLWKTSCVVSRPNSKKSCGASPPFSYSPSSLCESTFDRCVCTRLCLCVCVCVCM